MGYNSGALAIAIEQDAPPRLLQKIAASTVAAVSTVASTTIDGTSMARETGDQIAIQADAAFRFAVRATGATTNITNLSGARPGAKVPADTMWFFYMGPGETVLDIVTDSGTATVGVYLVKVQ